MSGDTSAPPSLSLVWGGEGDEVPWDLYSPPPPGYGAESLLVYGNEQIPTPKEKQFLGRAHSQRLSG